MRSFLIFHHDARDRIHTQRCSAPLESAAVRIVTGALPSPTSPPYTLEALTIFLWWHRRGQQPSDLRVRLSCTFIFQSPILLRANASVAEFMRDDEESYQATRVLSLPSPHHTQYQSSVPRPGFSLPLTDRTQVFVPLAVTPLLAEEASYSSRPRSKPRHTATSLSP